MRNGLLASALVALAGLLGVVSAQAPPRPDAPTTASRERLQELLADPLAQAQLDLVRAMLARQEAARQASTCAGPGNVPVALNEEIFFDGRAYRCVEVFGPNEAPGMASAPLTRRTVGLVRVGPVQPR